MKRLLIVLFALVVLGASPALAHVTVTPSEVPEGGFATLTFRVPNESESASTISLEVVFPEAAPFRSVSVKPTPGWTHEVTRAGDTVTAITWEGGEIRPGEFQEFDISVGPIPEVDVLEFKAVQTYDDGEVARWIDPVVHGEAEPDHPAPSARVLADDGDDEGEGGGGHGGGESEASSESATAAADVDPDDDAEHGTDTATFVALLVAGVALAAAVAALAMARNRVPQ